MTNILLQLHIIGGTLALLAMLLPILSPKGGRLHRRSGWVFVGGMGSVCSTALLLSAYRYFTEPSSAGREFSMLLVYVSILTGAGMWAGLRVLRAKRRTARGPAIDIAWAALLAVSGGLAAVHGFTTGQPLFIAFSTIGVINGGGQLFYWLRRPALPMHWRLAHLGNMLGACIAATTAFAIAGGRRFGLPGDSLVTWLGPTLVGVPAILVLVAREHLRYWQATAVAAATRVE
ncbi:MAG TPA: DUF2306 domain-containing protein [Gammaproteobacteria bacterium]|nr:DUF2306 domain-containing protein [Gammaproteobacteria bacterium]